MRAINTFRSIIWLKECSKVKALMDVIVFQILKMVNECSNLKQRTCLTFKCFTIMDSNAGAAIVNTISTLYMGHAVSKENILDRIKLSEANILNCYLKIITANLCKVL